MSNIPKTSVRSGVRRLLYSTLGIQMLALPVAYAQGRRDAQPQNKSHARRVSDSYADEVT